MKNQSAMLEEEILLTSLTFAWNFALKSLICLVDHYENSYKHILILTVGEKATHKLLTIFLGK